MSDYLANLAARTIEQAPALRPRLPGLFEPAPSEPQPDPAAEHTALAQPSTPVWPAEAPPALPHTQDPGVAAPRLPQLPASATTPAPVGEQAPSDGKSLGTLTPVIQPSADDTPPITTARGVGVPRPQPAAEPIWVRPTLPTAPTAALLRSVAVSHMATIAPSARPADAVARAEPAAPAHPTHAPTIQVTIGRIEVRATPPAQAPQRQRSAPAPRSLDEYLRQRGKGGDR